MNRQEANQAILKIISEAAELFPDLRFSQVLSFLNLEKLGLYEESAITLKIAESILKDYKAPRED